MTRQRMLLFLFPSIDFSLILMFNKGSRIRFYACCVLSLLPAPGSFQGLKKKCSAFHPYEKGLTMS